MTVDSQTWKRALLPFGMGSVISGERCLLKRLLSDGNDQRKDFNAGVLATTVLYFWGKIVLFPSVLMDDSAISLKWSACATTAVERMDNRQKIKIEM